MVRLKLPINRRQQHQQLMLYNNKLFLLRIYRFHHRQMFKVSHRLHAFTYQSCHQFEFQRYFQLANSKISINLNVQPLEKIF